MVSHSLGKRLKCRDLFLPIALLPQDELWEAAVDIVPQFQIALSLNLLFKAGVLVLAVACYTLKVGHKTGQGTGWFLQVIPC